MPSREDLDSLIEQLRELSASSPTETAELSNWYAKAKACETLILRAGLSDLVPHNVWHYLADAEIRVIDPGYRRHQQAEIVELIDELVNAEILVDSE